MKTWRCSKCGLTTTSDRKPLVGVCVKGGHHRWLSAGSTTPAVWRCGKCGGTCVSANRPLDRPCVRGGKCLWRKN